MAGATPRDPSLSAGRRAGAAKARAHKAARNSGASISRIGQALLPKGEKAPGLTEHELLTYHPTCIALYQELTESEEAAHFRRTDWYSTKVILLVVSGHLNDMVDHTVVTLDPDTGREVYRRDVPAHVKVGVLNEIARALETIHATPAGRTAYALALAALAKATASESDEDAEQAERELSAAEATKVLLKRLDEHAAAG